MVTYQAWIYASAHWRDESSYSASCRYFVRCEVCVNKGGSPVCGEAKYVDEELARQVAWFNACYRAVPHPDFESERDALDEAFRRALEEAPDPCRSEFGFAEEPLPTDMGDVTGFRVATKAEELCLAVKWQDPEGMLAAIKARVKAMGERSEGHLAAHRDLAEREAKARSEVWLTCIRELPRYSAKCTFAGDQSHFDEAYWLPREVREYGLK
jgi:hypothetical protein